MYQPCLYISGTIALHLGKEALGGLDISAEGRGAVPVRRRRLRLQDQVQVEPRAALPATLALLRLSREDRQGSRLTISSAWLMKFIHFFIKLLL